MFLSLLLISWIHSGLASTWSEWWTYEGISGPDFWGLVNPDWSMCSKGRQQSPVNIEPKHLLFDPFLQPFHIDKHKINGMMLNTGRDIRIKLDEDTLSAHVNISSGPLSYQYRITDVILHFGSISSLGSEHTINGVSFPAEIQLIGYNAELYSSKAKATDLSHGLAAISILCQVNDSVDEEVNRIAEAFDAVRFKGNSIPIRRLSLDSLIPGTVEYMTYDGSLTQPGCQESVTWIIVNKPLYLSNKHLSSLRQIKQGESSNPKVAMENNCRPTMPINRRFVRTNINFNNPTLYGRLRLQYRDKH